MLVSLYAKDMPTPSHNIELALYANDMTIISTSHSPALLVSYFESYLSYVQWWLIDRKIDLQLGLGPFSPDAPRL